MKTFMKTLLLLSLVLSACGSAEKEDEPKNSDTGTESTSVPSEPTNTVSSSPVPSDIDGYNVYQAADGAFEISYPADWTVSELSGSVSFVSTEVSGANLGVLFDSVGGSDATAYAETTGSQLSTIVTDPVISEPQTVMVSGESAVMMSYSGVLFDMKFDWMQWFVPGDGGMYVITYTEIAETGASKKDAAQVMVDSFQLAQ